MNDSFHTGVDVRKSMVDGTLTNQHQEPQRSKLKPLITGLLGALVMTSWSVGGAIAQTAKPNIFQMPDYAQMQQQLTLPVIALFRLKQYARAETSLRQLIEKYPDWPVHHYNLASALARLERPDDAFASLDKAISLGFTSKATMTKDADLASLRSLPRFEQLLTKLTEKAAADAKHKRDNFKPRLVEDRRAIVDETNTIWQPRINALVSVFKFKTSKKYQAVIGGTTKTAQLLTLWNLKGEAAGNIGDLYDNRDGAHSPLNKELFPQLSLIEYSDAAKAVGADRGLNAHFLYNAITFGNSSTALTKGPAWRSQARLMLTKPGLAAKAYQQYANDHLYIYPEHKDHDAKDGDLFPANTPYMLISQGSSHTDRPFMRSVSAILAAFRPETKAFLRKHHLVMPTVQMIFRKGMNPIKTPEDYMSAKAHPTAFEGKEIDIEKMILLAHDLRPDEIPPRLHLSILDETKLRPAINYFGPSANDNVLFNTPSAIARIMRSTDHEHRMVLSAEETRDPNGHPLSLTWKVLRGDNSKINIKPLNDSGSKVEITVKWHTKMPVPLLPELTTNRVDIAAFADNGKQVSAPAFVSFYYPPNQKRTYDKTGRITEIDYVAQDPSKPYVDPILFGKRNWRDNYTYTDDGQLIGWQRTRGKATRQFTRHGARIMETDETGRATKALLTAYGIKNLKRHQRQFIEQPIGKFILYTYKSDTDLLGTPRACRDQSCSE